jgi:hypothetical protein
MSFRRRQTEHDASGNPGYVAILPVEDGTYRPYPAYNYAHQYPILYNTVVSDQLMLHSPSTSIVENGQEEQYCRYYKEVTSRQLSGI